MSTLVATAAPIISTTAVPITRTPPVQARSGMIAAPAAAGIMMAREAAGAIQAKFQLSTPCSGSLATTSPSTTAPAKPRTIPAIAISDSVVRKGTDTAWAVMLLGCVGRLEALVALRLFVLGRVGHCRAAQHRYAAGAHQLDHLEVLEQLNQGIDLVFVAGGLDDDRVRGDVHNLGVEDVDDLQDLAAVRAVGPHLDQGQLAADDVLFRDVADVDDVYELVHLLDDLLGVSAGVDDEGHAGQPLLLRVADGKALDVEPALTPLGGDAVEDAGAVLPQGYPAFPLLFFQNKYTSL